MAPSPHMMQMPVAQGAPMPGPPHGPPMGMYAGGAPPNIMIHHGGPAGMPPGMPPVSIGHPMHAMPPDQHHIPPQGGPMPRMISELHPPQHYFESRLYEMNKRLPHRTEDPEQIAAWWDAFSQEFFDDDAQITLRLMGDEGGRQQYAISRTLIPRFYRTLFEGGVKDLFYIARSPCRILVPQPGFIVMECDNFLQVTRHDKPTTGEVHTEGKLVCEFVEDMAPRIKHWFWEIHGHQELVAKHIVSTVKGDNQQLDALLEGSTRLGLPEATVKFLRLCVILQPMQQLMSVNKMYRLEPRDCLEKTMFARYSQAQAMSRPPTGPPQGPPMPGMPPMGVGGPAPIGAPPLQESDSKVKKSRKRRSATSTGGAKKKASSSGSLPNASPAPLMSAQYQMGSHVEVMTVGEPSLMGGEYGEEDERHISRLENSQYDPSAAQSLPPPGALRAGMVPGMPPHMMPPGMYHHHGMMPPLAPNGQPMPGLPPHMMGAPGIMHQMPGAPPMSSPSTPGGRIGTPSQQPQRRSQANTPSNEQLDHDDHHQLKAAEIATSN